MLTDSIYTVFTKNVLLKNKGQIPMMFNYKEMSLLQTPPIKTNVRGVGQRWDGRIDIVPSAILPKLTLLANTETTIRNLLHDLCQFLSIPRCGSNELSRAGFQRGSMTHEHDITGTDPDGLENQPRDVVHPLVKLQVRLVVFQILKSYL